MRDIGIHIRLEQSINEAMEYAIKLQTPILQCFLIDQARKRPIKLDDEMMRLFKQHQNEITTLFVHGSYFINLANLQQSGHKSLRREVRLAKQLGAPYFILHPGSAPAALSQEQRIAQLARILNTLVKEEPDITFVLENTAHGGSSVGSDFRDFKLLKQLLDQPDQIGFCIDTAHAHSYGYDLSHEESRNNLIDLIDETMGLNQVLLMHLNDAWHDRGSRIDKHASIGAGTIGQENLQSFILNPRLSSIPVILELPVLPYEQEVAMLQQVRDWHRSDQ